MSRKVDEAITNSRLGAYSEMIAACWLMSRGYEVLRNVAATGPVDLAAISPSGQIELFDVKSTFRNQKGELVRPRLTARQAQLGVKCLCVLPDDSCEIDEREYFKGIDPVFTCQECGTSFSRRPRSENRFCSQRCGQKDARRKRLAAREPGGLL